MDTFFFIYITFPHDGQILRLGPYTTMSSAAEIMVDCLPNFIAAEFPERNEEHSQAYTAALSEWIIHQGQWEQIAVKVTETRE